MNKRSKLWAILGAGVLTLGVVGFALAHEGASDQGINPVPTEGNITIEGGGGNNAVACDADDAVLIDVSEFDSEGEASATTANGVTVNVTYDATDKELSFEAEGGVVLIAYVKGGSAYNTYDYTGQGGVDADGHLHPPANASGQAGLSHVAFCTGEGPEPTPTFEQSEAGETDAPSDEPSFEQSQAGVTDEPTEPNTAMIGNGGTSAPADGAWLLVVALGVLLASIVVLSPARAKNPR